MLKFRKEISAFTKYVWGCIELFVNGWRGLRLHALCIDVNLVFNLNKKIRFWPIVRKGFPSSFIVCLVATIVSSCCFILTKDKAVQYINFHSPNIICQDGGLAWLQLAYWCLTP